MGNDGTSVTEFMDLMFEAGLSVEETLELMRQIIKRDGLVQVTPEELRALVKSLYERHRLKELSQRVKFNAAELMKEDLPPLEFTIDRILPTGLTILAGKPKTGKSWLALHLAVAVAEGRKAFDRWSTHPGGVIYCALEDGIRRISSRLTKVLGGERAPRNLDFVTELPKLDSGGLGFLDAEISGTRGVKFVVIDTFSAVRPYNARSRKPLFQEDYDALKGLRALANKHDLSILGVHHLRKGGADDSFDQVSGTLGLNAAADNIWVLDRCRGRAEAVLKLTGRDIEEGEWALALDEETMRWSLAGAAEDYTRSGARQVIIEAIRKANTPLGPKEVAMAIKKPYGAVRKLMIEMAKSGELQKTDRGKYHTPGNIPHNEDFINNNHITHNGNEGNQVEYASLNPETFVDIRVVSEVTTDYGATMGTIEVPDVTF